MQTLLGLCMFLPLLGWATLYTFFTLGLLLKSQKLQLVQTATLLSFKVPFSPDTVMTVLKWSCGSVSQFSKPNLTSLHVKHIFFKLSVLQIHSGLLSSCGRWNECNITSNRGPEEQIMSSDTSV